MKIKKTIKVELTNEEIKALKTTHELLYAICQESECEECPLKNFCGENGEFDPMSTIKDITNELMS